jgi:heme-degrading monooxygenase HmoA
MWVRLGHFAVKPGCEETLRRVHREQVRPHVAKQPGLVANLLLEPVAPGGAFVGCTVWRTRADGEAYETGGAAQVTVGLLREFFAGAPVLTAYESESYTLPGA